MTVLLKDQLAVFHYPGAQVQHRGEDRVTEVHSYVQTELVGISLLHTGQIEGLVFPKVYEKYQAMMSVDDLVVLSGKLSIREDEAPKLLVDTLVPLDIWEEKPKVTVPDEPGNRRPRVSTVERGPAPRRSCSSSWTAPAWRRPPTCSACTRAASRCTCTSRRRR